ncbi:protein VASCULATURE COMPLEXITY AND CONNECTIVITY-like [Typha angustifolia]|uniref:protein VASCULATURE COMPLEXITY AND CONNECTIVITY-like n=1 Tax=Typha angustifolia TaxID=59011 RepID=UPI003C2BD3EC
MARVGGIFICLLIVIIDIVAGILGIQAEIAQNKGKHLRVFIFECKEPVHQAYKLGLAAAVLLALAHALANLLGGCVCICSREEFARSSINRQLAATTLGLSWIVVVVGFAMLLVGAISNSKSRASCGFGHRHFLSIGGILCFIHGLLSVCYYVVATAALWEERRPWRTRDAGVPGGAQGTQEVQP